MNISNPTNTVYYQAGWRIGTQLPMNDLEEIPAKIEALGVGNLKFHSIKENKIIVKWYECLTCSHLPSIGQPLCYLESGLLAGALYKVLEQPVDVEETKCWGTGDNHCEMEATIASSTRKTDHYSLFVPEENNRLLINLTLQSVQAVKNSRQAAFTPLEDAEMPALSIGEAIFQTLPIGLMVINSHEVILKINKACAEVLGIPVKLAVGRLVAEVMPSSKYLKVFQTGKPEVWEFQQVNGTNVIVIETPLFSKTKIVGVLSQVFSAETELVRLLLQKLKQLEAEVIHYRERLNHIQKTAFLFHNIQTLNYQFRNVLSLAQKAAQSNATILILGESGTGKGVLAQAIHKESPRRDSPLVKVDCAAIPPELLESELFGYEEGAFTGAKRGGKPGKFEMANGGTIFLDEIGDMPVNMQAKLLRVLQDKEFERLGGTKPIKLDIRMIAATNKALEKLVQDGRFREDLFYRLNVVKLVLPPLRERPEDIPLLVKSILERLELEYNRKLTLTPAAMSCLMNYNWPGNVRELENVLERAFILADQSEIYPHHLPVSLHGKNILPAQIYPLQQVRSEAEKEAILLALENFGGEKTRAAKALGLSRQALYAKMAKYGLLKR